MLPNLIVIGAMKCGTTSLHRYLGAHPDVFMSEPKELNFFIAEVAWSRGVDWYAAQFPADRAIRGESSPSYTHAPYFAGVPERMASVIPDAKLIYLVRDPVDRIVSHWIHETASRREQRDLATALRDLDGNGYVEASRYAAQLERYLEWFPREQVLVLRLEDLESDRSATLATAFRFLGVDPAFRSARFERIEHRSSEKRRPTATGARLLRSPLARALGRLPAPLARRALRALERPFSEPVPRPVLPAPLRGRVRAHLRADGERLARIMGKDLSEWYSPHD